MSIQKKTLIPRIGVASLCSPLEVGADRAPQAACDAAALFQAAGCQVVELGAIDRPEKSSAAGRKVAESHVHAVVLVAASWFEDYLVFDLLEECRGPTAAVVAAWHGDWRVVRRATTDGLFEATRRAVSGRVRTVGFA